MERQIHKRVRLRQSEGRSRFNTNFIGGPSERVLRRPEFSSSRDESSDVEIIDLENSTTAEPHTTNTALAALTPVLTGQSRRRPSTVDLEALSNDIVSRDQRQRTRPPTPEIDEDEVDYQTEAVRRKYAPQPPSAGLVPQAVWDKLVSLGLRPGHLITDAAWIFHSKSVHFPSTRHRRVDGLAPRRPTVALTSRSQEGGVLGHVPRPACRRTRAGDRRARHPGGPWPGRQTVITDKDRVRTRG
ncbi:hypothetical protein J8273_6651 [Carpediemonas membranifera]|uniref:Uncharacterized protein n=1 Tax=Carpediemonas membranifera TaxID=201153 RepID=A0A8J6ATK3_9EUKA|nr:hypothetical protein J8273_6651 [Carpediemonas membranifera]|eukprot:KAG9392060.1 hypothetical protein J8273_6651 [Carpediemonas membranifera]